MHPRQRSLATGCTDHLLLVLQNRTMATIQRAIVKSELRPSVYRERHALLQRVLWSRQFERSERLRSFLEFVTTRALADPDAEVHEQEIGHQVFDRRSDYDTATDNIVRVSASQIRKKLEEYFSGEGISESIVLEIPKGRYTPLFHERIVPTPPSDLPTSPQVEGRKELLFLRAAVATLSIISALCVGLFIHQHMTAEPQAKNAALMSLWSNLFSASRPTTVVVSDSSLSLYEDLIGRQLSLAEYLAAHSQGEDPSLSSDPRLSWFARLTFGRGLTSRASTSTVYRIAELKNRDQSGLLILGPKDFNMNALKFGNVVLLGSPRANPWVDLIENKLNFRYVYDQTSHYSAFENHSAKSGEPAVFPTNSKTSYCRIAFLPNLSGNGTILNIAGTETEGTEGGGEYITNEKSLQQLRQSLGIGQGTFPYFEVLLRSERVGGATPQLTIIATRLIPPSA
jgi:hypothetical protein